MKTYPISVARNHYRGSDPKKKANAAAENRDAATLENHVNQLLLSQKAPVCTYGWMEISRGCGLSYETVARLGYSIDGGSNGFTTWRHDMSYEAALEAHKNGLAKED